MSGIMQALVIGLGAILAVVVVVLAVIYLIVPVFKGIGWLLKQVFTFIGGMLTDALRAVGTVLMVLILTPLAVGSIIIGRWSATAHYGRAIQNEFKTAGACLYRIVIGHPARLLCLTPLLDGVERRLPEVVAAVPGRDAPRGRAGQFAGYRIVGSLPTGGSGSRLYIAEPEQIRLAAFERAGLTGVDRVVIKSFSIHDGSSLPQIVRESRSLDAAKKLGLVLDHELTAERFHYVMRYVPGESLTAVTHQLHAESGAPGLDDRRLSRSLGFLADLVRTLDGYHRGGLWHKDVKPDNIIVDGQRAHLVDFGLLSSLRSAMTLTTHGTEYFRDPEMVRMALKGVKVHEVDGAKFDVFAAGAVMYSVVENSFPAHGALSQITKRCPDAVRWVVRRAMTDYDKRYASAAEMLADIEFIMGVQDPFAIKPAELPSMRGGAAPNLDEGLPPIPARAQPQAAPGWGSAAPAVAAAVAAGPRVRPKIRVTDWWTGRYAVDPAAPVGAPAAAPAAAYGPGPGFQPVSPAHAASVPIGGFARAEGGPAPRARATPRPVGPVLRGPAKEQLKRAKARAKAAQDRAHARMSGRLSARRAPAGNPTAINAGVGFAATAAILVGVGAAVFTSRASKVAPAPVPVAPASPVVESVRHDPSALSIPPSRPLAADAPASLLAAVGAAPDTRTGSLLVVSDVFVIGTQPHVRRYLEQMEHSTEALRRMGFNVLGDAPQAASLSSEESDRQVDLISRVRRAVGPAPKGGEAMVGSVLDWNMANPEIRGVVWIWPDSPNNPARFNIAVVADSGAEVYAVGADDFDLALVSSVHAAFERD